MTSPPSGKPYQEGETGRDGSSLFTYQDGAANALALNRDNSQVVVAGRHIFKVFSIEENGFSEKANLRTGKNLNLNFSCNDVAWSPLDDNYLATAATNGSVVIWNLGKPARTKQEHVFQDHTRTVNKVSFHGTDVNLLLSGSQDGTMKLFDIRMKEVALTFLSNTESVRDVQFNPHSGHQFVAVSDNGTTQLWDCRKPDRAERQFTSHSGPIFACDWHPDYRSWLATAGRDKTIKVWNVDQKCFLEHTVWTIAPVGRIKWRPQRKYHIASAALVVDCSVNIWDVRRPYVPFAAFTEHKDVCTGIAWRSNDPHLFLSVAKDGFLWQHSFEDAKRPADGANPVALAFGVKDDVAFATVEQSVSSITQSNAAAPQISRTMVGNLFGRTKSGTPAEIFVSAKSVFNLFGLANSPVAAERDVFVSMARNYRLVGKSFSEVCDHNASIAQAHGKQQAALTWQVMKVMFDASSPFASGTDLHGGAGPAVSKGDDHSGMTSGIESGDSERRSLRHFSGDNKSTFEGGSTSGSQPPNAAALNAGSPERSSQEENSDSDDGDLYNRNLVNIACAMGRSVVDDLFDVGELELGAHYPELDGDVDVGPLHDIRDGWHLPTEAFELKQEIVPPSESSSTDPVPNALLGVSHGLGQVKTSGYEILGMSGMDMGTVTTGSEFLPQSAYVPVNVGPTPQWDFLPLIAESLEHFAEVGDVQTAVTLLLVLGNKVNKCIPDHVQEQWCHEYIDLLQRHELWNVSNMVIRLASNLPHINTINQNSTVINTACPRCHRATKRAGWICDTCHDITNTCCVCHQVVKGLYLWCQGCSHGGHLTHLRAWFTDRKECPSGCGHFCEFS